MKCCSGQHFPVLGQINCRMLVLRSTFVQIQIFLGFQVEIFQFLGNKNGTSVGFKV